MFWTCQDKRNLDNPEWFQGKITEVRSWRIQQKAESRRQEGKDSVSKSNYRFPYLKWALEKTEPHFSHMWTVKRVTQESHTAAGDIPAALGKEKNVFHHKGHAPEPRPEGSGNTHTWSYSNLRGSMFQEICSYFDICSVLKKKKKHLQKSSPTHFFIYFSDIMH